jgi:hypothetical protein
VKLDKKRPAAGASRPERIGNPFESIHAPCLRAHTLGKLNPIELGPGEIEQINCGVRR